MKLSFEAECEVNTKEEAKDIIDKIENLDELIIVINAQLDGEEI